MVAITTFHNSINNEVISHPKKEPKLGNFIYLVIFFRIFLAIL